MVDFSVRLKSNAEINQREVDFRLCVISPCDSFTKTYIPMKEKQVFVSVCSQKGGVGKSTFTVLLASWLHYVLGRDVLVVDCDAPQ